MNHSSNPQTSTWSATVLAKMALVTALYVVVTVLLAPLSFGPIQLRLNGAGYRFVCRCHCTSRSA